MPERNPSEESVLFEEYTRTRDLRLRERLITRYVGLVSHLARRFRPRGDEMDDLVQVGFIGLIKAIDRFDAGRGTSFTSFAVPTIMGEIRHYYRDVEQALPLPRRLQELRFRAAGEVDRLTQALDRPPSRQEIADTLETTADDVAKATAGRPLSLDGAARPLSQDSALGRALRRQDADLERSENRADIAQILSLLSPRERIVLYLRFYVGLSQGEVAKRMGISQMQVSRLQHRSLEKVKQSIAPGQRAA